MQGFLEWLFNERRQELVPQKILAGYEAGFQEALKQLLRRVEDPVLRDKFREMLDCPIKDARGRCTSFTQYILGALIRHGIHRQADLEDVLAYIYATLMLDRKANGEPKATVFGSFDADRPYAAHENPLEARFKVAVGNAIRNVAAGRVPRLFNTERRPQGTVSGALSDELPSRPDQELEFAELVGDIRTLLRRKELAYGLPLVTIFASMLAGERQRSTNRATMMAHKVIVSTIRDYAASTGNEHLLQLLQRLESPADVRATQAPKTTPLSTKERDYGSILAVVDRLGGQPVGSADLGRYRRRWLDYPPRDAASGHPNRMKEVLANMLWDGALRSVKTGRGAEAYVLGPTADKYRRSRLQTAKVESWIPAFEQSHAATALCLR